MKEHTEQVQSAKPPLIKRIKWSWVFFGLAALTLVTLSLIYPAKGKIAGKATWTYIREMIFIFPTVLIAMGLFMVWVNRQTVIKYLGETSGPGGLLLAIALGTLPTGPLYAAFPLALMLIKKGARVANVMAFLCSWAAMSIPAELMEFRFLGWQFTLLRFGLTFALIIPLSLFGERLFKRWGGMQELEAKDELDVA
jgi:uncharacterized membrane protein YraQ (UPF0718 family)